MRYNIARPALPVGGGAGKDGGDMSDTETKITREEILEKVHRERSKWRSRNYGENGKFIIGIEIKNILLASPESRYMMETHLHKETLMGFDYVVDYQNPYDINFCPIDS